MVVEEETSMEAGLLLKDQNGREECRITSAVILSTLVATCGSLSFGCAISYSSAVQPGIMQEFGLSVAQFSAFGSILTLGGAIGALFSGKIAVLIGRKRAMWGTEVFFIVGWLTMAFAQGAGSLDFGRFSVGIAVGLTTYVVPVYIAEISPKNIRGAFTFSNQLFQNCGAAIGYLLGNYVNWRSLALIGAIPCVIQFVALFFIPESPRWLAKMDRVKEMEAALLVLRGKESNISAEAAEIKAITEESNKESKSKLLDLFQKKYHRMLTIGIGLMLLQQFSGSSGVLYYTSAIFKEVGFSVSIGTTVVAICLVPKAVVGVILVDSWGRRPLLMASAIGMCFSSTLIALSFAFKDHQVLKEVSPIAGFIGVLVYITTYAIGLGALPWIIMSEIFPIDIKASAGTLATFSNWSISWIVTYTFNFMLQWNPSGTFFIFSGVCGAALVFVWVLVPETKAQTLEEIQTSLMSSPKESSPTLD